MIILTEEEVVAQAEKVICFLEKEESLKDLSIAHWIAILGHTLYLLGFNSVPAREE